MKRKLFIGIILAAIAVAIIGFLLLRPVDDIPEPKNTPTPVKDAGAKKQPAASSAVAQQPGVYQDYSEATFASAKGTRLLFFHAPWCPQCRKLDESIKKTPLPNGLTIFKVDYDTQTTLRQQYGVTLQTTIVNVGQDGTAINKIVAYDEPSYATLQNAFNL